jgi:hypothetical protein
VANGKLAADKKARREGHTIVFLDGTGFMDRCHQRVACIKTPGARVPVHRGLCPGRNLCGAARCQPMRRAEGVLRRLQGVQKRTPNVLGDLPQADPDRCLRIRCWTSTPGSFYQTLPSEAAFQFAQRFEWHDTPKKGSWLNMAKIKSVALATQCLDRRIAEQGTLDKEALAWARNRNKARKTVHWKFTKHAAREKLKSKYPMLAN